MPSTSSPSPWKKELQSLQHENTRLKAELRFANGLVAALLIVVFWGYWHQPEPSSSQPLPKRKAQPSTARRGSLTEARRSSTTIPQRQTPSQQPKQQKPSLAPLRTRSRPIDISTPARPQRKRPHRRTPALQRKKRNTQRAPRFGDPLAPEEAPARWCKPGYVYSYFYPCLQRGSRRKCLRRSRTKRYTCIPRSWWKRRHR